MTGWEIPVIVRHPLTADQVARLRELGCHRVTLRDHGLPHQIVMGLLPHTHLISVSCTCMGAKGLRGAVRYEPIEVRACWHPGEAIARWKRHIAEGDCTDIRADDTAAVYEARGRL